MPSTSPLENIHVAKPCPAAWGRMRGDGRVRFCEACRLNVYNLSAMTAVEAEALVSASEGRVCVRFYRRADGTVLTEDCPEGLRRWRRRVARRAGAVLAALLGLFGPTALASRRAAVQGSPVAMPKVERARAESPDALPTLAGVVSDVNGAAVAGARVRLTREGVKKKWTAVTDDEGRFRFKTIEAGEYRVIVEAPGFQTFTTTWRPLRLEAGEVVTLGFTLHEAEPEGLTPAAPAPR